MLYAAHLIYLPDYRLKYLLSVSTYIFVVNFKHVNIRHYHLFHIPLCVTQQKAERIFRGQILKKEIQNVFPKFDHPSFF